MVVVGSINTKTSLDYAERKAGELLADVPKESGKRTDLTSSGNSTRLQKVMQNDLAETRISQLKSAYEVYEYCKKSIKHLILSKLTAYEVFQSGSSLAEKNI